MRVRAVPTPRKASRATAACLAWVGAVAAAQDVPRQGTSIAASLNVLQSYTDNRDLSTVKTWDAVTQVSPSIRISSRSGAVQGSLDYTLNAQAHANDSSLNDVSNALSAAFKVTAVEQRAWVDLRASIAQQALSAFGVQTPTPLSGNRNRAEVRSLSIAPQVNGQLGDVARVEAGVNWTRSNAGTAADASGDTLVSNLRLLGKLGSANWTAEISNANNTYDTGRETTNRRINLGLEIHPHYDWQVSIRAGRETDTVRSLTSETTSTWGAGAVWTPSERTTLSMQYDRRYFGNGHSIVLTHRMARSIWSFSETRDVGGSAGSDRGLSYATAYDNLFNALQSQIPDPVLRDLQVRALLATSGGFISRAQTLDTRRNASVALQGVRTSITLTAFQSDSRRVDSSSTTTDDLSLAGRVRQHGWTAAINYQLTPASGISLSLGGSATSSSGSLAGNDLRTVSATYSNALAPRINFSLLLRRSFFASSVQPYTESGGQASLGIQF